MKLMLDPVSIRIHYTLNYSTIVELYVDIFRIVFVLQLKNNFKSFLQKNRLKMDLGTPFKNKLEIHDELIADLKKVIVDGRYLQKFEIEVS